MLSKQEKSFSFRTVENVALIVFKVWDVGLYRVLLCLTNITLSENKLNACT